MSIVDAIQRAKQMGKQRRAEDRRQREPSLSSRQSAAVKGAVAETTEEVESAAKHAMLEPVEFPRLSYDSSTCAMNHIIVPDVEPRLALAAAAPYRMLRTRILQRCRSSRWSSISITSPGPGEGKTVTALNLAISIAREGNHDVFLIDLDMRNPSVCPYLGIAPRADVLSYFRGTATAPDIFFTIGIDRLTLAGSTVRTDQSSELLASGRLEELLAYIRRISPNPLILLDLPPVVNTDDALVVAPRVDATVLIASEGHTRRDGLERAVGLLSDFTLAGVVLNRSYEMMGADSYGGAYA